MQPSVPEQRPPAQGPLVGVRVLDLSQVIAGPFVASLLGDFGADVVKVELPGVGDPSRTYNPKARGIPGMWAILARNKRSITLDIRKEKGKELVKRLVATADVVVENFRPGTLEEWGLGFEVLKAVNRKVILVRVSGFGQTGSWSHKVGLATPASAFAGLTYLQGYPDRPPICPPFAVVDYMVGSWGAMAAAMALFHIRTHPDAEGQQIDVSLFEPPFRMLEKLVAEYDYTGKVEERSGHVLEETAPAGSYQSSDGKWIALGVATDRLFGRLARAMGRPELLEDPRFAKWEQRSRHKDEVAAIVQEWFSQRTQAEALRILEEAGCPAGPTYSIADIFQEPHYRERGDLIEVPHPVLGKVTMPGVIPKFSGTPGAVRFPGPVDIGEHNREVYHGELGLTLEEMEVLRAEGVI